MNHHKKIGFLLFILTIIITFSSVTAWATEITPEQVEKIIQQQEAESRAAASALAAKSSKASSKKPTGSTVYSSSGFVSEGSSEGSSELYSSSEESSELVLPSVNSVEENNPLSSVVVDSAANRKMNWIGLLSWACIALGMIVILIVVFSNRRPPRGGPGRKRYRRPSRAHKKRLLSEKYYRNTKF